MALGLALACAGTVAVAQTPPRLKAGLWEHSFQMGSQGGQLEAAMKQAQAAMASMPPEQRKMMEQMMAKQGIGLDASGQKVRVCLTPEDVARDQPPAAQDGCTQSAQRSGNTWTVSFQCPGRNGAPPSSGRGTVTLQSPTAYSGQFAINTQVGQKSEQVNMTTQGRWVAAECGSIKPVGR
jgi:hypothetical protein